MVDIEGFCQSIPSSPCRKGEVLEPDNLSRWVQVGYFIWLSNQLIFNCVLMDFVPF